MPEKPELTRLKLAFMPTVRQRRFNKTLELTAAVQGVFLLGLWLLSAGLFPLEQTKTQYLFLRDNNIPVRILPTIQQDNQALIEGILRKYVINREQILKGKPDTNDLLAFGSKEVNDILKTLLNKREKRDLNNQMQRTVQILRYQILQPQSVELHIRTIDNFEEELQKPRMAAEWLIRIKYQFEPQLVDISQTHINPTGLKITIYNLKQNV